MMRIPDGGGEQVVDDDPEVAEVAGLAAENHGHFGRDG